MIFLFQTPISAKTPQVFARGAFVLSFVREALAGRLILRRVCPLAQPAQVCAVEGGAVGDGGVFNELARVELGFRTGGGDVCELSDARLQRGLARRQGVGEALQLVAEEDAEEVPGRVLVAAAVEDAEDVPDLIHAQRFGAAYAVGPAVGAVVHEPFKAEAGLAAQGAEAVAAEIAVVRPVVLCEEGGKHVRAGLVAGRAEIGVEPAVGQRVGAPHAVI